MSEETPTVEPTTELKAKPSRKAIIWTSVTVGAATVALTLLASKKRKRKDQTFEPIEDSSEN